MLQNEYNNALSLNFCDKDYCDTDFSVRISELLNDFNKLKDRIVYKIINYDENRKLLENVPHKKILDFAVVYYCILLKDEKNIMVTPLINNKNLETWNKDLEEIERLAKLNTPKLLKAQIQPLVNMLLADTQLEVKGDECEMYVLTNETGQFGASCLLYDGILEQFAEENNTDFYILPSSIHEVILLPVSQTKNIKRTKLTQLVRNINESEVSACDRLSDNVYNYCINDKKMHI